MKKWFILVCFILVCCELISFLSMKAVSFFSENTPDPSWWWLAPLLAITLIWLAYCGDQFIVTKTEDEEEVSTEEERDRAAREQEFITELENARSHNSRNYYNELCRQAQAEGFGYLLADSSGDGFNLFVIFCVSFIISAVYLKFHLTNFLNLLF